MVNLKSYAKAIFGFISPGVVTIGGALTVNSDGGGNITSYEWVSALIACLVTGGLVYAVPNQPYINRGGETLVPGDSGAEYIPERARNEDEGR